jgi:hypothetical protein
MSLDSSIGSTTVESGSVASADGQAQDTSPTPEGAESQVATGEPSQAPSYQPKLKYKVLDQEKDFPDWAKPIVKSPEVEKTIRDMLERAEGLDHVKQRREVLEGENRQLKESWGPIVQDGPGHGLQKQKRF